MLYDTVTWYALYSCSLTYIICTQIPTDGLVLRGWYTTITLAVYGVLTKSVQEAPPPPPPGLITHSVPPQAPCPADPRVPDAIVTNSATAEWVQQHAQVCLNEFCSSVLVLYCIY